MLSLLETLNMAKNTTKTAKKPRPDFPLFAHRRGYWAKKVLRSVRYSVKIATGSEGVAAVNQWLEKDEWLAGRNPRHNKPEGMAVKDICDHFRSHKKGLLESGEITQRTFTEYENTCHQDPR
jgi:hypothetical protein